MRKNKQRKLKPVLSDHKRHGKRFIPPLLQLGPFEGVKWDFPIFPEILWLGMLNEGCGKAGPELAASMARAAIKAWDSPTKKWFGPASAYGQLTPVQKSQVRSSLVESGELEAIKNGVRSLVELYPECPLSFLFEGNFPMNSGGNTLAQFKDLVSRFLEKYERSATLMQANAIYIAFACDMLYVQKGSLLAKFPDISRYPDTEVSKGVAAVVRATINGFFGMDSHYIKSSSWPGYFWNRGLELEPCDYSEIDKVSFK